MFYTQLQKDKSTYKITIYIQGLQRGTPFAPLTKGSNGSIAKAVMLD